MGKTEDMVTLANAAVEEAERCRLDARQAVTKDPSRYAGLMGQPSGWCVVTQKGLWGRKYHDRFEESRLRDCIARGHKVVLTVGLVAKPDSPLSPHNHVLSVAVGKSGNMSKDKLSMITTRAKLHAVHALS